MYIRVYTEIKKPNKSRVSEGMRMVSGFIGDEVPRKGLRVRVPCPPLQSTAPSQVLIRQVLAAAFLIDTVNCDKTVSIRVPPSVTNASQCWLDNLPF